MCALLVTPILKNLIADIGICKKRFVIYCDEYAEKFLAFSGGKLFLLMDFNLPWSDLQFSTTFYKPHKMMDVLQIVGKGGLILLLDSDGKLWQLFEEAQNEKGDSIALGGKSFCWIPFSRLDFKVLTITTYQEGFACLGVDKNGKKMLKSFDIWRVPEFKDLTFHGLNTSPSNNYYLKSVKTHSNVESLIISDRFSGRTYVCTNETQSSLVNYSNIKLVSAILINTKASLLFCFETGKLIVHHIPDHSDQVLFLPRGIVCIEKCFCSDTCLLWSDGVNLHHTEITFDGDKVNLTHFEVQCNIKGAQILLKCNHVIFVATINTACYLIRPNGGARQEVVERPSEILSQIFNGSLQIDNFQKNIKISSDYLSAKEIIQNNHVNMELNCEGGILSIKNMTLVPFKKEFWKIKLKMSSEGCESVKIVEMETDLLKGSTVRIQNSIFIKNRIKVYLLGEFDWETLCFCIGEVGEDIDARNENLKCEVEKIRLQKKSMLKMS